MSLGVGAAFTSSHAWASKCNLIPMVLALWTIHTEGIGEDNEEVPFAAASLGSEARWGLHSISSRSRSQSWKPGKHRLKGRTKTAHQQSNNTTDDRPRGKPRATGPRAHAGFAKQQLQPWKRIIQTWALRSCRSQRARAPQKQPSGTVSPPLKRVQRKHDRTHAEKGDLSIAPAPWTSSRWSPGLTVVHRAELCLCGVIPRRKAFIAVAS